MPRYTRKPANTHSWDIDEDEPFRPGIEVADHEPIDTGLLWPDGEAIIRNPNPIGFGRDQEW